MTRAVASTNAPPNGAATGRSRGLRPLGLFTVLCIGINNIVGSGIFSKPSKLAAELGPASWIAFAADALLLVTVALCFAAMASRHDAAGGPYLYAKQAFGKTTGFIVAWTAWISMWAALAAVATAVPPYLAIFVGGADGRVAAIAIGIAIVVLLGAVNCAGVKSAAGTATLLTVAKLLPLLVFVAVGLFAVDWSRIAAVPTDFVTGGGSGGGGGSALADNFHSVGRAAFGRALFAAFYPLQGFEVVPVPAGELRNPRRDVPLAVTLALLASAALYCLIQIVAVGTCPALATVESSASFFRPLATAAQTFLGSSGEKLIAAGACVSMVGFAAVTMFCAPRFLVALGNDGLLPRAFARHHPKTATPTFAVIITTASALFGVLFSVLDQLGGAAAFERLTALSNIAVLVQYTTTCLAVITLRAHLPSADGTGFRLVGGRFVIPVLGLGACAFLLFLVTQEPSWREQIAVFGAWVVAGVVLSAVTRRATR